MAALISTLCKKPFSGRWVNAWRSDIDIMHLGFSFESREPTVKHNLILLFYITSLVLHWSESP